MQAYCVKCRAKREMKEGQPHLLPKLPHQPTHNAMRSGTMRALKVAKLHQQYSGIGCAPDWGATHLHLPLLFRAVAQQIVVLDLLSLVSFPDQPRQIARRRPAAGAGSPFQGAAPDGEVFSAG